MFSFVQSKPKGRKHYYSFPLLSYDKFSNSSLGHNSSTSNFATALALSLACCESDHLATCHLQYNEVPKLICMDIYIYIL